MLRNNTDSPVEVRAGRIVGLERDRTETEQTLADHLSDVTAAEVKLLEQACAEVFPGTSPEPAPVGHVRQESRAVSGRDRLGSPAASCVDALMSSFAKLLTFRGPFLF